MQNTVNSSTNKLCQGRCWVFSDFYRFCKEGKSLTRQLNWCQKYCTIVALSNTKKRFNRYNLLWKGTFKIISPSCFHSLWTLSQTSRQPRQKSDVMTHLCVRHRAGARYSDISIWKHVEFNFTEKPIAFHIIQTQRFTDKSEGVLYCLCDLLGSCSVSLSV